MKLSIIVPVYNVEKYIARCIDSLLNQNMDFNEYEILIIDDGSTDNSLAIAQEYLEFKSNIFIHSQINSGVGATRNRGIDLARGEYIYFIDPDDYIVTNILKSLITNIDRKKLEILTFSSLSTTKSNLNVSTTESNKNHRILVETGIEYIGNRKYKNEVWWFFVKRDFLQRTGIRLIEDRWMEDAIFTAQIFLKSSRIGHIDIDVHRHVVRPNSAMTSIEENQYLRVIRDIANAATVFESLIKSVDASSLGYHNCLKRLKTKQHSFVFFMMLRMLQSSIKLEEIKSLISEMKKVQAYPLHFSMSNDYNKTIYKLLILIFNNKHFYYLCFLLVKPIFRFKNRLNNVTIPAGR